ncbi:threonine/serine exporter family protein [Demequina sp. B12]|uniref:threonine/serine ThrE exporter family protein n=1 Tax=Demequina sp. B12 TaxID=2992757 RepID=UPI00237C0B57|nr:threonine/serine exporter family protein [Demequina sp. B12]MDE0572981.1 threonine/serine exporter family protein [Demequina sp. B12]
MRDLGDDRDETQVRSVDEIGAGEPHMLEEASDRSRECREEIHDVDHEHEESLEPVALIEQSRVVLRTGRLMLAAGTASYRVKQAMQAVALSIGVHEHTNHVAMTDIAATSHRGRIFRTEVAENRSFAVNTDRLWHLDRMRRTLPQQTTPAEVHRALDEIEGRGALYPGWVNSAVAGLACAAFAVLNGAVLWEVLTVFVAAAIAQWVRRTLAHRGFNGFGTTLAAAVVSTSLYVAGLAVIGLMGPQLGTHAAGYISSVLFLLPGFALITGALDMAKLDLQSGIQRIAYGTMMTMAAGVAVWAVSLVSTLDTQPRMDHEYPLAGDLSLWAAASFLGVLGFALMFNSPWRMALSAAVIGAIGNTGRLAAIDAGMETQMATAVACLAVGCMAAFAARGGRFPHITLSVPAVLVMIPGVAAHQALVAVNQGDYLSAVAGMLEVTLVVLSIMVGLVGAKLLTDKHWAFED